MKVLLVFAHPGADSLNAAIRDRAIAALEEAGHSVDLCDLYAEGFDPVLTAEERAAYFDTGANRARNAGHVERLFAAEGLVFVFPTWTLGPPAILKGFFDRVMVPGVSFQLDEKGGLHPNLRHIRSLATIVTYGRDRPILWWFGDPPRKMFTRYMPWFLARRARVRYLPLYNLHKPSPAPHRAVHGTDRPGDGGVRRIGVQYDRQTDQDRSRLRCGDSPTIDRLMGAAPNTPEGDELEILIALVEAYEAIHWPIARLPQLGGREDANRLIFHN